MPSVWKRVKSELAATPAEGKRLPVTQASDVLAPARAGDRLEDPLADDLMRRVAVAIDEWRVANRLESVPRPIAFEQAVSILNAAYKNYLSVRDHGREA